MPEAECRQCVGRGVIDQIGGGVPTQLLDPTACVDRISHQSHFCREDFRVLDPDGFDVKERSEAAEKAVPSSASLSMWGVRTDGVPSYPRQRAFHGDVPKIVEIQGGSPPA